ncbi:MAG TPA: hypothetical protein VJ964_11320 [Balneolaceae bacterium]|nr:hypothetical protein [Balneolaceae bacterium]
MFFRWLHKSWKYFWGILLSILLVIVIIAGSVLGLLQLDATQDYIANRIEQRVNKSYKAKLSIGDVSGFLPFRMRLNNVVLVTDDSVSTDTLAAVDHIDTQIDIWGLLQRKISISSFTMAKPRIWLQTNEEGKIVYMKRRTSVDTVAASRQGNSWISGVEILAPQMEISKGYIYVMSPDRKRQNFSFSGINSKLFVDWGQDQRYLDIESFSAHSDDIAPGNVSFSGQVYNDARYLEFNSFYLTLGNSRFVINGEVDGVNILKPDFRSQLLAAKYDLNIQSDEFYLHDFEDIMPPSDIKSPFNLQLKAEGTTDSLLIDKAELGLGESSVDFRGVLKHLQEKNTFAYNIRLDQFNLQKEDLAKLIGQEKAQQYRALQTLRASGKANGTADSVDVNLDINSALGEVSVKGQSQLVSPYRYVGTLNGKNLDISPFAAASLDTTNLNFDASIDGSGFSLKKAVTRLQSTIYNSKVNNVSIDQLKLTSSLVNGLWKQDYEFHSGDQVIQGSGSVDFSKDEPAVSMQGSADNLDLVTLTGSSAIASTKLNFGYNVQLQGVEPDRIQGRANLDIKPSIIGGDSVRAHQFYMDLNSPDQQTRSFRLTSSLFDMNVTGHIVPSNIIKETKFWTHYLRNRYRAEILMDVPVDSQATALQPPQTNMVLNGNIKAKNLGLIKRYFPDFPTVKTDSKITFKVNADDSRMLVSAEMQADTLRYNKMDFSNSRTQFTANFRSDRTLKQFSMVDLQADIGSLKTDKVDLDSMGVNLSLKQDSVRFTQHVGKISNNASFKMTLNSSLSDSAIAVTIPDFFLGNSEYSWENESLPSFTYKRNGAIDFHHFSFKNQNQYFQLKGTLSKDRSDSLTYVLRDINLDRISDLIKGKVNFAGVLNGTLITRSLTRQPTIQGSLTVNKFALNDRMIGDVRFKSKYNPRKDHFDTNIDIITDSTKYGKYLDSNDDIGQNIQLNGYFKTPDPDVKQDTLYYFNADFKQIDMWVIPLIVNNVFQDMEGQSTGQGYITGNLQDFDFHADFQAKNVYAKPRFLNTNYFVNGHVILDRHKGVTLDSLKVMDTKGGTGIVTGNVDLNDFKPITYLDLTMDMNKLQFLNNKMDPDVPFFGSVSGTGTVRLTGANNNLYMRTKDPIKVTSDSDISIPLLEQTELNESGKFIQFVDSFDQPRKKAKSKAKTAEEQQAMNEQALQEAIQNMTFSERFDLDLQFEAPQNVNVHLIFDPVTGEVLTAQGTGQIRITMQDQDVQMFGRYNINGGTYQFVTGEIISRKLDLEPGGSIVWEGQPDNARLDISAVYHARPNINTLTSEGNVSNQNQSGGQQVPVDLIVEVNGTLNSVENNYYFKLPTSLDLSSNSTLSYTINQINRDDQQKLLQATSILLTGQFIPTQGANGTASLSQSLTKGTTVLNPLLSNQVISPLLSNQINALLNSDVSRLDVDFNLNAYNEVDLGIALRLYNDRLILRREGQITGGGPQTTLGERIGDLNATYRIRRGLSLTAFHRQDQILNSYGPSTRTGDVTPTVDGVGFEAQVHFNTWKELMNRIGSTFHHVFGKKKKDKNSTENQDLTKQKAKEEQEKN